MSKCTICNSPLRFGKRSHNTTNVNRIKTGNMDCYNCHPHIHTPSHHTLVLRGLRMGKTAIRDLKVKCRRQLQLGRKLQWSKDVEKRRLKKSFDRQMRDMIFTPGVYGIWRNDELVYVGESKVVWKRIYHGHFRLTKKKHKIPSPVDNIITPHNKSEFKWGYLVYVENEHKRILLESQYIARYAPRLNSPYIHLKENELKQLQSHLHSMDMDTFTIKTKEFFSPVKKVAWDSIGAPSYDSYIDV